MTQASVMLWALFCLSSQTLENPIRSKRAVPNFPVAPKCPLGQLLQHNGQYHVCCQPTACTKGYQIETCRVNGGKDRCVECLRGSIQLNNISSFNMVDAECFQDPYYNARKNYCPIQDTQKFYKNSANCAMFCECKTSSCYVGSPCGCASVTPCGINEQLNKHTIQCEPCPKYSYKNYVGCESCTYNLTLFSQGAEIPLLPKASPSTAAPVNDTTTKEHRTVTAGLTTAGLTVNGPQGKDISLSWMELMLVILGIVLAFVITAVVMYCCWKRRVLAQLSKKICPNFSQSSAVALATGNSSSDGNTVTANLSLEMQPLMQTTANDALMTVQPDQSKGVQPQTSIDSGFESPDSTKNNISASGPFLSSSAISNTTYDQSPSLGSFGAQSLQVPIHDVNTPNVNSAMNGQTLEGRNDPRNGATSENQSFSVNEGQNSSRNGVFNQGQDCSRNGVATQDQNISSNRVKSENQRVPVKECQNISAYGLNGEGAAFDGSQNSAQLADPDANSILETGEVFTTIDQTLCKSLVGDETSLKLSYARRPSEFGDHVEYREAMCDKSIDVQNSLGIGSRKAPVAVVRPLPQETDESVRSSYANSISSYPGVILESDTERMCDFSVSSMPSNDGNNGEGQSVNRLRGEMVTRDGPEGRSRSRQDVNQTSLKQLVSSENTDLKSVNGEGLTATGDGTDIRLGASNAKGDTCVPPRGITTGVRRGMVTGEVTPGGQGAKPKAGCKEKLLNEKAANLSSTKVNILNNERTEESKRSRVHAQSNPMNDRDCEEGIGQDELKLKAKISVPDTDSFSGILPHSDSSVEISWHDNESRSESVEMELVTNMSNVTMSNSCDDGSLVGRGLEREEGDGAYSVELELFNGSDNTERVDSVETCVNDEDESVEIILSVGNDNSVDTMATDKEKNEETEESVEIGLSVGNDNSVDTNATDKEKNEETEESVEIGLSVGNDNSVDTMATDKEKSEEMEESLEIGLSVGNDNSVDMMVRDNGNNEETDLNGGDESVETGLSVRKL